MDQSRSRPRQTPEGSSESVKPPVAQTDEDLENFETAGWKIWALPNIPRAVFVAASVWPVMSGRSCAMGATLELQECLVLIVSIKCCLPKPRMPRSFYCSKMIIILSLLILWRTSVFYVLIFCGRLTQGSRCQSMETQRQRFQLRFDAPVGKWNKYGSIAETAWNKCGLSLYPTEDVQDR